MQMIVFVAAEETAEKSGLAVLGIDPIALLLQLTTFLILFLLLKKFAFNTIVRMLEERRRTIDAGVDLGQEMAAQKQQLDETVADILKKARQESDKIIAAGHHEAGVIVKEAEAEAERKADALLADVHNKIAEDISKAKKGLEAEMLSLVAEATEAVISEKLSPKKDAALITRALHEVKR